MASSFLPTLIFLLLTISISAFAASPQVSTISAAPTLLPESPFPSPTLHLPPAMSPDIDPQLPTTPGPAADAPDSSSSIPTIPATASPPNPDAAIDSPTVDDDPAAAASSPSGSPMPLPTSAAALPFIFISSTVAAAILPLFSLCFVL